MKITPATLGDLIFVVDHLSVQNAAELAILGHTKWQALKIARGWLDGAVTAWWEDQPGFIFGIHFNHTSWFLATQVYFDGGTPAVRAGRQFVKQMRTLHGGFVTLSRSPHPAAERWFRLIGLRAGTHMGEMKVWWCGSTPPVSLDMFRARER